uniref:Uncharacterized protein n=1 Tax=Sus scrofa TaxID=9823 RepID=A0A8D0QDC7_PIG
MASRRMETKPVITCLKTLLIIYSFVFWAPGAPCCLAGQGRPKAPKRTDGREPQQRREARRLEGLT